MRNNFDWANCFAKMRGNHSLGFLAQLRAVSQMTASSQNVLMHPDGGEVQCCGEFNVTTSTHICFHYLLPNSRQEYKNDKNLSSSFKLLNPTRESKMHFPKFPDFDAQFGMHPRRQKEILKMVHFRRKVIFHIRELLAFTTRNKGNH